MAQRVVLNPATAAGPGSGGPFIKPKAGNFKKGQNVTRKRSSSPVSISAQEILAAPNMRNRFLGK